MREHQVVPLAQDRAALLRGLVAPRGPRARPRPRSRARVSAAPNIGTVPIGAPGRGIGDRCASRRSSASTHCAVDVALLAQQRRVLQRGRCVRACRGPWRSPSCETGHFNRPRAGAAIRVSACRAGLSVTSSTPASTSAAPASCIANDRLAEHHRAEADREHRAERADQRRRVRADPADRLGDQPRRQARSRRSPSRASARGRARGTASAASGRVSAKWTSTNAVDASIAHAMKRDEPSRAMTPPAPTR